MIKPLGFPLDDTKLRRAGLDYHEYANLIIHENWQSCKTQLQDRKIYAVETCAKQYYTQAKFNLNDAIIFGSETKGLPAEILAEFNQDSILRLPMQKSQRSLNLSNSVAIVVYEAWRQLNFIYGI